LLIPKDFTYLVRSVVYPVMAFLAQNTVPKLKEAFARLYWTFFAHLRSSYLHLHATPCVPASGSPAVLARRNWWAS
jgi:hypothetical protein